MDDVNSVHLLILKLVSLLQRRLSLEDWTDKLLSDIDISRSVLVATFLELEAAARSCRCILDTYYTSLNFYYMPFLKERKSSSTHISFNSYTFQHSVIHSKVQM